MQKERYFVKDKSNTELKLLIQKLGKAILGNWF